MKHTWWQSGDYNAICDVCGFKFKASQLKRRWDGLQVCEKDWEIRHPQELIRPIPDQSKLPWTRPESTDSFIAPNCTIEGRTAIAGYAVAGCMIAGNSNISLAICTPLSRWGGADFYTADCMVAG